MTELKQIYKCEICGNIVEVLHTGAGSLVCCGEDMKLFPEQTAEQSLEKHVPVLEKNGNGYIVKVGSTEHPMLENHFIEWIEIETDTGVFREFLEPGKKPVAEFTDVGNVKKVREFCNIHGLWVYSV